MSFKEIFTYSFGTSLKSHLKPFFSKSIWAIIITYSIDRYLNHYLQPGFRDPSDKFITFCMVYIDRLIFAMLVVIEKTFTLKRSLESALTYECTIAAFRGTFMEISEEIYRQNLRFGGSHRRANGQLSLVFCFNSNLSYSYQ